MFGHRRFRKNLKSIIAALLLVFLIFNFPDYHKKQFEEHISKHNTNLVCMVLTSEKTIFSKGVAV